MGGVGGGRGDGGRRADEAYGREAVGGGWADGQGPDFGAVLML